MCSIHFICSKQKRTTADGFQLSPIHRHTHCTNLVGYLTICFSSCISQSAYSPLVSTVILLVTKIKIGSQHFSTVKYWIQLLIATKSWVYFNKTCSKTRHIKIRCIGKTFSSLIIKLPVQIEPWSYLIPKGDQRFKEFRGIKHSCLSEHAKCFCACYH